MVAASPLTYPREMKPLLIVILVVCVAIGLLFIVIHVRNPYSRFLKMHEVEYGKIAASCDELIAQAGTNNYEIRGQELQSLPLPLRNLDPYWAIISTNCAMIRVGKGVISYKIVWAPDDTDPSLWHLRVYGGDNSRRSRIVLSVRKS